MREILFRGKHPKAGWVEGAYIPHETRQLCCVGEDKLKPEEIEHYIARDSFADWNMPKRIELIPVDPSTVGQFSSLPDKNGTKIFEDDLVEYEHGLGVIKFGVQQSPYDSSMPVGFYIDWLCDRGYRSDLFYWAGKVSVVGNIHDNPELLGD